MTQGAGNGLLGDGIALPGGNEAFAMRCAEVQELLAQGHSLLYFNAPKPRRLSPYADEVDRHAYYCPECSEQLIRLLRARLRRRPGPFHLLRVNRFTGRMRSSLLTAQASGIIAEEAPIVRVANVIIQQAIKENASEVRMVLESSERPFRPDVPPKPVDRAAPEEQPNNMMEDLKRDIRSLAQSAEPGLRVCVSYHVGETWHDVMAMPAYIAPPLWVRFKSMADLLVTVQGEPQHGRIPIRYENRDFDVVVDTAPGEFGETLLLTLAPARHPDRL